MTTPDDWIKKYADLCDSFIARDGSAMKRKSYKFPETTIHDSVIQIVCDEFWIYEKYGTWFLRGLT